MRVLACAMAGLIALPALAACPVPQDMAARGVRVTLSDGSVTTYRRLPKAQTPREIEEATLFPDGGKFVLRAYRGVLLLESYDVGADGVIDAGSRIVTTMTDAERLFPLVAGTTTSVTTQDVEVQSGARTTTIITVVADVPRKLRYGTCTVRAIPLRITAADQGGKPDEVDFLDYLPNFGISVYLGSGNPDGGANFFNVDRFEKVLN